MGKRISNLVWRRAETRLLAARESGGCIPNSLALEVAGSLGIARESVYRKLRVKEVVPARTVLSDAHLADISLTHNVVAAWRHARKRKETISLSTFRRAFNRLEPGVKAGLLRGEEAMRQKQLYVRYETTGRGECLQLDTLYVDVALQGPGGVMWPRLLAGLDDATRFAAGVTVFTGGPTGQEARQTVVDAMIGETAEDGTHVGCVWTRCRYDLGSEFINDDFTNALVVLGTSGDPVAARSPWLKGKVERFFKTLHDEFLITLPGHKCHTPIATETKEGYDRRDGALLTLDVFVELLSDWIHEYNYERRHESLGGRTPFEAFRDDPTPLEKLDDDRAALALLRTAVERTVRPTGIEFRKLTYIHPDLMAFVGTKVQICYLDRDPGFIHVVQGGRWICKATPVSDDERISELLEAGAARQTRTVRNASAAAAKLRAAKNPASSEADSSAPKSGAAASQSDEDRYESMADAADRARDAAS